MANLTLNLRNLGALESRLTAAITAMKGNLPDAVRSVGANLRARTAELCPVDTGFMRQHIREKYTVDGLTGEVGWFAEDFEEADLPFYAPPVTLGHIVHTADGTREVPAQPSLLTAAGETRPEAVAEIRRAINEALGNVR